MSPRKKRDAEHAPTVAEVLRPAQLIGFAAILGVFVGLVVLFATRELWLAGIGLGAAFVVGLVVLAMFALTVRPKDDESAQGAERSGAGEDGSADSSEAQPK